jgi:hypothetical protein
MIKKLYIIKDTGHCIIFFDFLSKRIEDNTQENSNSDPQLISGFFAALLAFAEAYVGKNDPLHLLWIESSKIYFRKQNDLYFILETDKGEQNLTDEEFSIIMTDISLYCEAAILNDKSAPHSICNFQDASLTKEILEHITDSIRTKFHLKMLAKSQYPIVV